MNAKDTELMRILDNTIQCCAVLDNDGRTRVTREDVLGTSKTENISMVRTLVVCQIMAAGFTTSTAADLLHRTPQTIRRMCDKGYFLSRNSRAYHIAEEEATRLNKS